jgi:hypothetical protein
MLDTTPPEQRTRSWAMKWLFRGPHAFKAAGIEWDELMNAPDDPAPLLSFGRPPSEMNGHENRKHHFHHNPTSNNSLTHG